MSISAERKELEAEAEQRRGSDGQRQANNLPSL